MRTFKLPEIQSAYNAFRSEPPTMRGGIANAYWKGFNHPDDGSPFQRNSAAYGAWAAGVDVAREAQRSVA